MQRPLRLSSLQHRTGQPVLFWRAYRRGIARLLAKLGTLLLILTGTACMATAQTPAAANAYLSTATSPPQAPFTAVATATTTATATSTLVATATATHTVIATATPPPSANPAVTMAAPTATLTPESPPPATAAPASATETPLPSQYNRLLDRLREQGRLSIIIELDVAFTPEGELPDQQAVADQRQAIAAAQQRLLQRMAGFAIGNVNTYETIPFVAMNVDEAALRDLIANPAVHNIEEDRPLDPAAPPVGVP